MDFTFDLAAVFLPLFGAFVAGLFGRKIGDRGSQIITCGPMLLAAAISIKIFIDVALHGEARTHTLTNWFTSGNFSVDWSLRIDTLTAIMLVVVNGVSSMVHVYSVGYMAHDKGIPRFM